MEEEKLNQMYEMTRENNSMLRSMRRSALIGGILKFVFWILLLVVVPYYLWQQVQPYLQQIQGTYQSVQGAQQGFSNSDIAKFFQQFTGSSTK